MNYKISKNIPVIFHNGSTYDYHFIIKEITKEFKGQFECLGINTFLGLFFLYQLIKKLKKDRDGNDKIVTIPCKIKFMNSFRFMSTSLSSLVDTLSDGQHSNKCTDCKSILEYIKFEGPQLLLKRLNCNKNYKKDFNRELINGFSSTYKFCNGKINNLLFC